MDVLRTPDDCFGQVRGFDYIPRYAEVSDDGLRMAYV
jgi:hypothetical protein